MGVPNRIDRTLSITFIDISITSSDGQIFAVNLSAAATLTDAINAINAVTTVNVTAQLDQDSAGIELIDNTAGVDALSVTQSGSSLPITGGIDLTLPSDDFTITASDGQTFRIDLSDAISVGDVIDLINTAAAGVVTIQLTDTGNGLELIDQTVGIGSLTITQSGGSQAAEYLGFLQLGQTQVVSLSDRLTSEDRNYLETDSVFNTLIRLRDALQNNDITAIERAVAKVDADIDRVTFSRAEVGAVSRVSHSRSEDWKTRRSISARYSPTRLMSILSRQFLS